MHATARIRTKDLGAADETLYATAGCSGKVRSWLCSRGPESTERRGYLSATALMPSSAPSLRTTALRWLNSAGSCQVERISPVTSREDPVLTFDEIQRLTCVDGWNHVTLVAENNGALIALGRYDRLPDPRQAEVAFAVADAHQHHHIASELLRRLAHVARMAGVSQFKAEVLPENATMLAVFEEAGFPVSSSMRRRGSIEMTLDIVSSLHPSVDRPESEHAR